MNKKIIYILLIVLVAILAYLVYYFTNNKEVVSCISNNTPVCGVDNITYEDNCSIELAQVEVLHQGACQVKMANPASENCINLGGTLEEQLKENGNYNLCYFEDNRQCEEWALFYGKCPVGGVKITGYDNREQIYCAVTGGEVSMGDNSCTLDGIVCNLEDYYNGTCEE